MALEQYAYLSEIIAAIAVIASLIYIGSELRQNTQALQAQSRFNMMSIRTSVIDLQIQDRDLLGALHRFTDGGELTAAEESAVKLMAVRMLENWQWQHGEVQAGTLLREQLPVAGWCALYHGKFVPNAVSEIWEARKVQMNPDFVKFMEKNVINEG